MVVDIFKGFEHGMKHAEAIEDFLELVKSNDDVLSVILYGSYARMETYNDIDIAVVMYPERVGKMNKLDFLTRFISNIPDIFDIQIFQDLPLYVLERVLKDGKILLNKNYDCLFDIYEEILKELDDYMPHYRRYIEAI